MTEYAHRAVIRRAPFNSHGLDELATLRQAAIGSGEFGNTFKKSDAELIFNYPTVYVINSSVRRSGEKKYRVYVGETTNILGRTGTHLLNTHEGDSEWEVLKSDPKSVIYILGHSYFNKSLTLDVENTLMLYLTSVASVERVVNRRTNEQLSYYTKERFPEVFAQIWDQLQSVDSDLFPELTEILDSALYKASPFHKLTQEQSIAKTEILETLYQRLHTHSDGNLILVSGEAGSGKTVLLSSLFYDIHENPIPDSTRTYRDLDCHLLVNHDEQVTVYTQIAEKLGIHSRKNPRVSRPTSFINQFSPERKADVVLIDEAHLLWTQGKQSYRGKNQLLDIIDRAKVTIAVFDSRQVLQANQWWEKPIEQCVDPEKFTEIRLVNQLRMTAGESTLEWLDNFTIDGQITDIKPDEKDYELKIFDSPESLRSAIQDKATTTESGLARIIATFDWPYSSKSSPQDAEHRGVKIGNFDMAWNREIEVEKAVKRENKHKSWAEQTQTIDEVGSIYTIQGFDLNYAGVIIGPSVKYRDGRVVMDPKESYFKAATNNRTLSDGSKQSFGEDLLWNQLYVLMTRGVKGLYIYAVDDELREALLKAQVAGKPD